MQVLVTGGLGFVGSHLVDLLIKKGNYDVTVLDNLVSESSSEEYKQQSVNYIIDDIRNINNLDLPKFDIIFHIAALARIQPSFSNPTEWFDVDARGTIEVLEFARKTNAKVVYSGSSTFYGGTHKSPYGFAKWCGEEVCKMYSSVYKVKTAITRFFNVYGERQPESGEFATIVGIFERQTRNQESLTVVGDGEQRRDFTHILDICEGLIAASVDDWYGDEFPLGTGINYSINELANMFGGDIKYIPTRKGEAKTTLADITVTKKCLNWEPKESIIEYVNNFKEDLK
jgi:UDP-glucose 4-epimerase